MNIFTMLAHAQSMLISYYLTKLQNTFKTSVFKYNVYFLDTSNLFQLQLKSFYFVCTKLVIKKSLNLFVVFEQRTMLVQSHLNSLCIEFFDIFFKTDNIWRYFEVKCIIIFQQCIIFFIRSTRIFSFSLDISTKLYHNYYPCLSIVKRNVWD